MANLAVQADVCYSINNPDVYIQTNIVGFLNILEPDTSVDEGIGRFVEWHVWYYEAGKEESAC